MRPPQSVGGIRRSNTSRTRNGPDPRPTAGARRSSPPGTATWRCSDRRSSNWRTSATPGKWCGPPLRRDRGSSWGCRSDRGRGEARSSGEGKHAQGVARRAECEVGEAMSLCALAELLQLPADRVLEGLLVRPRLPAELLARLVV